MPNDKDYLNAMLYHIDEMKKLLPRVKWALGETFTSDLEAHLDDAQTMCEEQQS